jgi:hypothetical protein
MDSKKILTAVLISVIFSIALGFLLYPVVETIEVGYMCGDGVCMGDPTGAYAESPQTCPDDCDPALSDTGFIKYDYTPVLGRAQFIALLGILLFLAQLLISKPRKKK